jgi:hypothetical protein
VYCDSGKSTCFLDISAITRCRLIWSDHLLETRQLIQNSDWQISFKNRQNFYFRHLAYLLTAWSTVLLDKLTGLQLVKKFPAFYATRSFITAFTSACHLSVLSQLNPVHTLTYHFLKTHLHIILPSIPESPQWSLSLRFPHQNPIHASPLPPCVLHTSPISFWILLPAQYWVSRTDHSGPHYVVFSIPLSPRPS